MLFSENQFYPTPDPAIEMMKLDCYNKKCYEPQAGSGNIVKYLLRNGAASVIATELQPELRAVLSTIDGLRIIGSNFFDVTAEQVSHVQLMVMNPPFANAEKHIFHAWDIAPEGCEIVSLMNWETLNDLMKYNRYSRLPVLIDSYGDTPENLGDCFSEADRITKKEIALVRLFKPIVSKGFDYEGFFLEDDETERQENGIMSHNEVRATVNVYIAAVRCFDDFAQIGYRLNKLTSYVGYGGSFCFKGSRDKEVMTKEDFAKGMQRQCWKNIFDKMNLKKIVTSGVMKEINQFIEGRQNYPFTMRNVYRMLEIIIGTSGNTMNKAIVEAIDRLTQYTHENRYGMPGWKTNAGHLLNEKFIVDFMVDPAYETRHFTLRSSNNVEKVEDLLKALCFITAKDYDAIPALYNYCRYPFKLKNKVTGEYLQKDHGTHKVLICEDKLEAIESIAKKYEEAGVPVEIDNCRPEYGQWFDWGPFQVRGYKKGTMHFKFKNKKDWEMLNRAYAKAKGQALPEHL